MPFLTRIQLQQQGLVETNRQCNCHNAHKRTGSKTIMMQRGAVSCSYPETFASTFRHVHVLPNLPLSHVCSAYSCVRDVRVHISNMCGCCVVRRTREQEHAVLAARTPAVNIRGLVLRCPVHEEQEHMVLAARTPHTYVSQASHITHNLPSNCNDV